MYRCLWCHFKSNIFNKKKLRNWSLIETFFFHIQSSFDSVQSWIRELRTYLLEKCLICIVGNKSDLADRRVVMHYGNWFFFWINNQIFIFDFSIEAKQYADSVDAFFIETSAKNCNNITELFINGLNRYREMEQSSSLAGQKDSPNHGQKSTRSISLKDGTRNSGKCC